MTPASPYKPGAFFLRQIPGPAGWWAALGEAATGAPSRWSHVGIILPDGQIAQSEGSGVRVRSLEELYKYPHVVCDAPVLDAWRDGYDSLFGLRQRVVAAALALGGTPYSILDYFALAALHLERWLTGRKRPRWWLTRALRARVEGSGHLIYSAFVDRVYAHAGIHLFDDGRLSGDVMPADLDVWAQDHGFVTYSRGA